jgi:NADH-quinone oxidoreductase subunit C
MLEIQKKDLARTLEELKKKGFSYLTKITAVDYSSYLEVLYFVYDVDARKEETVKVKLPAAEPLSLRTVMPIYRAADWYERELQEMFGIAIEGRDAKRLLLEEWNGVDYPLRKSFEWGKDYRKRE